MVRVEFEPSWRLLSLVLKAFNNNPTTKDSFFQDINFLNRLAKTIDEAIFGLSITISDSLRRSGRNSYSLTSDNVLLPNIQDCFRIRVHLLEDDKNEFGRLLGKELSRHLEQNGVMYQLGPNDEEMELLKLQDGQIVVMPSLTIPEFVGPHRQRARSMTYGKG